MSRKRLFVPSLLLLLVSSLLAQDEVPTQVTVQNRGGDLPFSTTIGTDVEHVDATSQGLHVSIPILHLPGRGMSYDFSLVYDSHFWIAAPRTAAGTTFEVWNIDFGGVWNTNLPYVTNTADTSYCNSFDQFFNGPTGTYRDVHNYIFHDSSGAKHPLSLDYQTASCNEGSFTINNAHEPDLSASGMFANFASAGGGQVQNVYLANGTQALGLPASTYKDVYGNQVLLGPGGTDTLGRVMLTKADQSGQTLYYVRDASGAQRTYTVNYINLNISTAFNMRSIYANAGNVQEYTGTRQVISSIVLPNGLSYGFQYDSYGMITEIDLPTGAKVTYTWGNDSIQRVRYVTSRTLTVNGQSSTWTFTRGTGSSSDCSPSSSCNKYTVTDPQQNQSVYCESAPGKTYKASIYQGSAGGTPVQEYDIQFWSEDNDEIVLPTSITTKLANGLVSKKEFIYDLATFAYTHCLGSEPYQCAQDPTMIQNVGVQTPRGNVLTVKEYDWAAGAPGPLLRTTTNKYLHEASDNPSTAAQYVAQNIVGKIIRQTIADGSGKTAADTQYEYDNATQSGPYLGSLTKVKRWRNTDGAWLATSYSYDQFGNITALTDPLQNETTWAYDDRWADSSCAPSGNSHAYVSLRTDPLGHRIQVTRFSCTGQIQAHQDENDLQANRTGTTYSYDAMARPLTTNFPDGGQTSVCYSEISGAACSNGGNPLKVVTTKRITSGISSVSTVVTDGLGRTIQTQINSDPGGTDYVDTVYDSLGRVSSGSNPYRSTNEQTYGVTQTQYDALGRVIRATKQDGSTVTTQYDQTSANSTNATCSTTTDEAGKARKSCVDGLGRLIEVDEPQASSGSLASPYVTLYSYDALGNMLNVNQKGDGSQTARVRSFTYDSLSRLLTATNPESGTISYSYDANGNVLQKTSPAPNQTGSASQTISYCYDAVNRVTGKAYSAQSCPLTSPVVTYSYDVGTNGIGHLTSLTDQAGSGSYSYDALGRITGEQRTIAGIAKSLSYTYNLDGAVATLKYPSGAVITYTPDAAGRTISAVDVANNVNYVTGAGGPNPNSGATYGPDDSLLSFNQGWTTSFAGIANTFSYNSRLQPVNMAAVSPACNGSGCTASINISGGLNNASSGGGSAPLAQSNTALTSFVDSNGNSHAFYLDVNQHVWHLFWNSSNGWQNQDLTAITTNTPAAGNSSLSAVLDTSGNTHVFYLDSSQHVHELFCCSWQDHDLTAMTGNTLAASGGSLSGAVQASGNPVHLYYLGTNQHVYHLFINAGSWQNQDLTTMAGGSAVAAGSGLSNTLDSSNAAHVFYVDGNQHINQLYCGVGQCWINQDLTAVTGNTLAATGTNITSYTVPAGNPVHAYYLGPSEHFYHLYLDTTGNWQNQDLSALTGGPTPVAGTALSSLIDNSGVSGSGAFLRHYYLDGSQRVNETVCGTGDCWVDTDLTVLLNTNSAAVGSGLTSFGPSGGNPVHVHYVGPNQHVYHLYLSSSGGWVNQDVSALSSVTLPDSGTVSLTTGGFTATACFGHSTNSACTGLPINNTASQVAAALAQALNASSSPVTATASGATVNLTWKGTGTATGIDPITTTHDNPNLFSNPSFTSGTTGFSGGSGANLPVFNISYDFHLGNGDNGNVYAITNNRDTSRNQTFTYDALNRLASAQNTGTDCTQTTVNGKTKYWGNSYGYDAWGDLLQKTVTKCSAENLSVQALANNQLVGYGYDSAGNMTHDATTGNNYTFDVENRITGAAGFTYTYDADGNRVEKLNGSTGTIYWYMSPGIVAESDLSGALRAEYVFFDNERVARKDFSSSTTSVFYYFSDHLKTASVITDSAGNIKEDEDYYPWGGELKFVDNDPNHYKFTSKELDTETGLDYFGARYYGNWFGRWMSPDWSSTPVPVPYADLSDPQSLNLYTYVRNVPTSRADFDGHCPWCPAVEEALEELSESPAGQELIQTGGKVLGALGTGAVAGWAWTSGAAKKAWDFATDEYAKGGGQGSLTDLPQPSGGVIRNLQENAQSSNSGSTQGEENQSNMGLMKKGSAGGPGAGKKTTPKQRQNTLKQNGGKCVVPGCDKDAEHTDHSIPRSRNGDTTDANLQGMCAHHNCQKGDMTSEEYLKWLNNKEHPR